MPSPLAQTLANQQQLYGFYPHLNPRVPGKPDTLGTPEAKGKLAEALLSVAPGSGEALSARDAWNASGRGADALTQGNYGQAASEYGNMFTGLLGAVPGAGVIARGTKRGAAWMNDNLPAGVNKLLDSLMPKDPRNTMFSGAGPTMADEYDTRTVFLPHSHFDEEHLAKVKSEMAKLGSPEIRGIPMGDDFAAIEGSHRLRAARELGLPVKFKSIKDDEFVNLDEIGLDDNLWFDGEKNIPTQDFLDWYIQNFLPSTKDIKVNVKS